MVANADPVAASRRLLLDAIGPAPDLTFVRGLGNLGDELIWAGTRELLRDHVYREIGIDELGAARGHTALIAGGGAFSRAYNEHMPEVLAVAELRFERVIVLPSSFDVGEDRVRDALRATRAVVFARERASLERIIGLCDARLAHDCAFFYDYAPHRADGEGTLDAFRTDAERDPATPLPPGNDDISATAADLDAWLATIARHEQVRTDRAHVMIAAALLGKGVEYTSSSYFKLEALAETWLEDFPVRRSVARKALPVSFPARNGHAGTGDTTAVILSRDRPQWLRRSVASVLASSGLAQLLIVDNNSGPATRALLAELATDDPRVRLHLSDRNLGAAGGRRRASELVQTPFTLMLDDDAELRPGALERLEEDLRAHPDAGAVTALVVYEDGRIYHYGGWVEVGEETADFVLEAHGERHAEADLPPTGPSGWMPGTAGLYRTALLREIPIDLGMTAYYEDNDWSLRVERARPGSLRRCREAIAVHRTPTPAAASSSFSARAQAVRRVQAHAHFFRTHGLVMYGDLETVVPALRRDPGSPDVTAARLLLELVGARGAAWTLAEWMGGRLDALTGAHHAELTQLRAREAGLQEELRRAGEWERRAIAAEHALAAETERVPWLVARHETLTRVEQGGWWRLRGRLLGLARR